MTNPRVRTARGRDGGMIRVGDSVSLVDGTIVRVVEMWRQGANGTIVRTDAAPDPEYPDHHQAAARDMKRVTS